MTALLSENEKCLPQPDLSTRINKNAWTKCCNRHLTGLATQELEYQALFVTCGLAMIRAAEPDCVRDTWWQLELKCHS